MKRAEMMRRADTVLKRAGIRTPAMRLLVLGFVMLLVAVVPSSCDRYFNSTSIDHLPPMEMYFSPRGGVTDAVVRTIDAAKESIFVQAYSFTSAPIAEALVDAHRRGVRVAVILDASQKTEKYSSADFLEHAGIPTRLDARHAIAHNKVMIVDGKVVITGSFNFTKAAEENNAENLLVIHDEAVARRYMANWESHAMHADPYPGATTAPKSHSHKR